MEHIVTNAYLCPLCDAAVEIPSGPMRFIFIGGSGRHIERAVRVAGLEVHRCELPAESQALPIESIA